MILRNVTRVVLNSTDLTQSLSKPLNTNSTLALTASDSLYLGYPARFTSRHFNVKVPNTSTSVLSVATWDGSTWNNVKDLFDGTSGFSKAGFIAWSNVGLTWDASILSPFSDIELYWLRIKTSVDFSSTTAIRSILNLFCDDEDFKLLYGDVFGDSRYIPPSQDDFVPQYYLGTQEVVKKLVKQKSIENISQVIDASQFSKAAVHGAFYNLIKASAQDDTDRQRALNALQDMNDEIEQVNYSVDIDGSGTIDDFEKSTFTILPRGGF